MPKPIDPKQYGLPPKTLIFQQAENHFALVIDRKSRIIMTDGKNILDKVHKIKALEPEAIITLSTSAPVCSKTVAFLSKHGISIEKM